MGTRTWIAGIALVATAAATGLTALAVAGTAEASSSSYSLATQTLPDGRRVVARWNPCQTITYKVNPTLAAGTASQRSAAVRDVQAAFTRATAATGMTFRYAGTTTQVPTGSTWYAQQTTAEIVVAWVNPAKTGYKSSLLGRSGTSYTAGTGGYAYKFWKSGSAPWTGATGRGFVVLNAQQNSKFKAGFGTGSTRGELLLHEIGHSLGLNHVGATSQTMYPTILSRSTTAGYGSGDRTGLTKLGATQGCISVPGFVWSDLS